MTGIPAAPRERYALLKKVFNIMAWFCADCGSVVTDRTAHDKFHAECGVSPDRDHGKERR